MAARIPEELQKKLAERLTYFQDIGISMFYRERQTASERNISLPVAATGVSHSALGISGEDPILRKTTNKIEYLKAARIQRAPAIEPASLPIPTSASLFTAINRVPDDTLLKIRQDLGECTRCKLHKGRNKIVFGDGNLKAKLVFVGEGPGHDEDMQGLPFVGRAGKLLTQMIEAMGLQRSDVYICNVVKCRPPENRAPEKDEVATCSPYLLRQIDAIAPTVIVCLGSVASQTLLETNRGISHYRGQWLEFRGRKLMATYHPAYLLRNPSAKGEVWKDLQKVMAVLGLELKKGKSA